MVEKKDAWLSNGLRQRIIGYSTRWTHPLTNEVKDGEITRFIPKTPKQYNEANTKKIDKSYRAKKHLVCGINAEEYNHISLCELTKEIWDCLRITNDGIEQVK